MSSDNNILVFLYIAGNSCRCVAPHFDLAIFPRPDACIIRSNSIISRSRHLLVKSEDDASYLSHACDPRAYDILHTGYR